MSSISQSLSVTPGSHRGRRHDRRDGLQPSNGQEALAAYAPLRVTTEQLRAADVVLDEAWAKDASPSVE
jgi:hypothetical protein